MPAINTLNGGGGNDVLSGLAGDDTLNGGEGDDRLYGGAGQNDMAGGIGNDWYIVDSLTDVIIEAAGDGTLDRVFTTLNYTLTAGAHVEIMTTDDDLHGAIDLTGNELANTSTATATPTCLAAPAATTCWPASEAPIRSTAATATTLLGGNDADTRNGDDVKRHVSAKPATTISTAAPATTGWRGARARTTWPAASATTPTLSPAPPTRSPKARGKAPSTVSTAA